MATNMYGDPGFWSQPSGMQGSQGSASSFGASGQTFPGRDFYGSQALQGFNTYEEYLKTLKGWGGPQYYNPYSAGPAVETDAAGQFRAYKSTPFSKEQFESARAGHRLGGGQDLLSAASSPQLDQYRQRLAGVLGDPSQIANDPNYQFLVQQGEGALSRKLNAGRMGDSGRALLEAQAFGQKTANQYLNDISTRYGAGITSETTAMKPRLGAEEARFNAYWKGAPWHVQGSQQSQQSLGFTG